ncbi:protein kinase [Facklamia hominis]|nr:protein kinase [Facklamia hominis]WPJ90003.1 protein kinase [Facklamia hominis]
MIEIHDKLSNRYVLNALIGSGGMANVFLAHDLILDRDVAVKVLRYDFQDNQDAIKRFQREAISASQLLHPNIVEVYDVDEHEKQQYIVMEYVKGQDLKSFIREHAPVQLELVVSIMSQIVAGIDAAHRNRIIHRDIKPQNVLITDQNVAKITDFGIAVALSDTSITQTNTLLGSVHYLSPEQARGSAATTKSDIYAMGVVLYELITGKVPHDGEWPYPSL